MDITWTKIIVAILFGVLRLAFGLLPIKLYSYLKIWENGEDGIKHVNKERQKYADSVITMVQSFGGGVLFATCFLHMMPEVYHAVHELEDYYGLSKDYPRSQLILCIGFFMIYFVEDFAQFMINRAAKCDTFWLAPSLGNSHSSSAGNKVTPIPEKIIEEKNEKIQTIEEYAKKISEETCDEKCVTCDDTRSIDSGLEKSNEDINIPIQATERDLIIELEKEPQRLLRCCLITMALSFHAIFEGIAIGLQNSVSNIWYLFVAISIHSVTLLFCVGVQLLFSHKRTIVIFYFIFVLSITSPVGIMIGLAVTAHAAEESMGTAIASALLEGLSAGTLLYITFFEVLHREKELEDFRLKRGICIIIGFGIMALLQIIE